MVAGLLHPLNIFIIGLGGGFLIPLVYRAGQNALAAVFILALAGMTLIAAVSLTRLANGAPPIEILTGGTTPPFSINLRLGLPEAVFAVGVNVVGLLGAWYFVRANYATMLLYLILVTGIQGMVMTRDLFNLFVFLEIVSIATYGLLSLEDTPAALSATFKFLMATVLASTFFLIGTVLIYAVTGMLNIDDVITNRGLIVGPIGFAALIFLLTCLLIELKPFPANGWGLDVYETAHPGVAALISGVVSAGVFFALLKLMPLFQNQLEVIAISGAVTFLFSNLIGLQQTKARRLLGYSSIGQMGLLTIAVAMLQHIGAGDTVPFVVGGLFVNHLFAKAGLFWLAGYVGKEQLADWPAMRPPVVLLAFGILLVAIAGLPPFPGFWAKWHLVINFASNGLYVWIAVIVLGSFLESVYLFRWFGQVVHAPAAPDDPARDWGGLVPVFGMAVLLVLSGVFAAWYAGLTALWLALPLGAGLALYLLDGLPPRVVALFGFAIVLIGGIWLIRDLSGLNQIFAALLFSGGMVVSIASLYRSDRRSGFYPLLAVMLLSLPALPRSMTGLEFLFIWELITLSSYFLILRGRDAAPHALRFLLFSLIAAAFLLAGFALSYAVHGSTSLSVLRTAGPDSSAVFVMLAIGLLIKAGAIGVHVWLPGAYAEADDDVSAMLSAVISKVSMFGLLVGTYVAVRSGVGLELAHLLGWIGMLTTLVGAMLAVRQDDVKRMLAYSSMSQLGYIVTAIALLSHLGWVTALYLAANHLMVKGILFLVAAAIILRAGTRSFAQLGGLARTMPLTFVAAAVAIVAMSGLPPLAGFGGKWLLLSAMLEKGWYGPAVMALLATFVGFLYMWHFIRAIFLGAPPAKHDTVREAPLALLVPQYLLIAGILVVSFYPKLLIEPISRAIDPIFASTLKWEGMSLAMIYSTWNPVPFMALAVAVAAILFAVLWAMQRRAQAEPSLASALRRARATSFYAYCSMLFTTLTPPVANKFWDGIVSSTWALAGRSRLLYTGNGQTYCLYILYYFVALYLASGGFNQILAFG
jgi:formate hydrogenlyase subunit 3/multisubunit Na+/H+ antiporter MnhD subunit